MTKVDIRRLDSVTTNDTTATQLINENFEALQEAIENSISRDGTTPNFMDADLDLNSYKIINAGTPTNNTDVITKEYFDQYVGDAPGYAAAAEQAANRASTSAQAAQGYSSVATGAANIAQAARDFIESDPGFQVVSEDLLLGEDSEIHKVNANKTNIDTVAGSISNVNTVSADITNVNAVAGNATNINAVNANKTNIDAVAGNNANITAVANNATNINAVNANKTNIDTVAGINADVTTVADIASDVTAVAGNNADISTVADDLANVDTVAGDIANVNAVAADLTNIDAASSYAASAKQYAVGLPTEPEEGSARYWAEQAAAGQLQADWTQNDSTEKDYIKNKPTEGDNISFANNQISAVSDASPTQNSTNLVQSGGVYSGLDNLQSQIDTILLSSDVYDVVGTYTDLQNYDISTVPVNDIIKVLSDSTHSDAASYYRCTESGGVKSWTYVGSEGPYYTKSEANTLLNAKANDSDVVKLTGNQTVAGEKTFTSRMKFTQQTPTIRNNNDDWSTAPAELIYYQFGCEDKNGIWLGGFEGNHLTDGSYTKGMYVRQQNGSAYASIEVGIRPDGSVWTSAPTPATSDNSTKIATTAFVNNKFQVVTALPANPVAGVFYFVKE